MPAGFLIWRSDGTIADMLQFGPYSISAHDFGTFRLDGGSMFGSVPKNLWAKRIQADDENCIALATRCLLIRDNKRTILVDCGMGEKWSDKSRQIYAIHSNTPEQAGIDPSQITDLILTHLHFDHAGGVTRYKKGTHEPELVFPQAKVFLQALNWENARHPNFKERASYLAENVEPLAKADLNLVSGTMEVLPNIWVHQVNGHTRGQQWVEIRNGAESIVYPTDLIPTSHHVPLAYHMGYDICAETLLKEKDEFLSQAVSRRWIVVCEHDVGVAVNNPHNEMNFVSFRDVELPAQITKTQAEKEIHFIDEAGKIHRNIDAILEIWGRSRGTSWLIKLGKLPGIKHLLRLGYRLVAANRHGHRRISDSKF
ncbi:MAG: MBL fold metallo-hydrolase [Proteobacteria bacterium]|nr:MAG: MBL fold metallo-hydrolase [Pseudomonadota bacterium]